MHSISFTDISRSNLIFFFFPTESAVAMLATFVSVAQAALRAARSNPGCKWSELVFYAQTLDDAHPFSWLWVTLSVKIFLHFLNSDKLVQRHWKSSSEILTFLLD